MVLLTKEEALNNTNTVQVTGEKKTWVNHGEACTVNE
jgi:hypothetical protein